MLCFACFLFVTDVLLLGCLLQAKRTQNSQLPATQDDVRLERGTNRQIDIFHQSLREMMATRMLLNIFVLFHITWLPLAVSLQRIFN